MNFTFLNGAFLFAALAALLPLIIHLISRRRVATVDFSSLRFLKELERRRIRRVRLRQLLLLIIRSMIILFAALALARPTLSGSLAGTSGSHARTSVAIVLDDSASMAREQEDGTLFDGAVDAVRELAALLDEGDQAFLVRAGSPTRAVLQGGTFSPDVLVEAVDDVPQGYWSTDYVTAIDEALELLSGSRNLIRELYVVGDMQISGWTARGSDRPRPPDDEEPGVESGGRARGDIAPASTSIDKERTRVYFMPLAGPTANLSLTSVQAERSYGGTAGLFSVVAGVTAFGWRGGEAPIRLFVDGVQVGQAGVDIGRQGSATARFSVTVDENEWHSCYVELPPDALAADNRRYFVIPRLTRTEVLLVRNASDGAADDAYFIERALDPTGEGSRFACSTVDAGALAGQDQGRFSVVVLADVERLDLAGTEWLRSHVASGGGVLLVLGNRTDIRFWNGELLPELTGAEIVRPVQRPDGVRLAPAGPGHPILEGLVFGERLIDDIYVRRALELEGFDAEEVLELPGIGPALFFRGRAAEGEIACLTIAVDPSWSDLPRSGFVVPLLHRVVQRLAGSSARATSVLVGEDLAVRLPPDQVGRVDVAGPEGSVVTAEIVVAGPAGAMVRSVEAPGVYSFSVGGGLVALGAVNIDPRESNVAAADRDEMAAAVAPLHCLFIEPNADLAENVLQARHGRELWRVFLYVSMLLVAVEMMLARQRYS